MKEKKIMLILSIILLMIIVYTMISSKNLKEEIGNHDLTTLILLGEEIDLFYGEFYKLKYEILGSQQQEQQQLKYYPLERDSYGNIVLPAGVLNELEESRGNNETYSKSQERIKLLNDFIARSQLLNFMTPSIGGLCQESIESMGKSDFEVIKKIRNEINIILSDLLINSNEMIGYKTYKYFKDAENVNRIEEAITWSE